MKDEEESFLNIGKRLGFNKQTGVPILFDNFHPSLTNYNMVIFAKSGAGKSVTMKTLISRSSVLMGIESLALDAEGEYSVVAEALGGINVVLGPNSKTVINIFDIETERVKDEIKKIQEQNQPLIDQGYSFYQRDYNSSEYEVSNCKQFLYGKNGMLYLVYPYGNKEDPSEMDVVIFE